MDGTTYSTFEVRIRAVRAVLEGMAIVDVARAYHTDRTTIHRWLQRFRESGSEEDLRIVYKGDPRVVVPAN